MYDIAVAYLPSGYVTYVPRRDQGCYVLNSAAASDAFDGFTRRWTFRCGVYADLSGNGINWCNVSPWVDKINNIFASTFFIGCYGRRRCTGVGVGEIFRRHCYSLATHKRRSDGIGSVIFGSHERNFAAVLGPQRVSNTDWLAFGALAMAVLAQALGYLRKPALVPSSRIADLESVVKALKIQFDVCEKRSAALEMQNKALNERVEYLEGRVQSAMEEREYWIGKWRELRDGGKV